jgi:hypothetical protein
MKTNTPRAALFFILLILLIVVSGRDAAGQGASATPQRGAATPTPTPSRAPRKPRLGRAAKVNRRAGVPRSVTVRIATDQPFCNVLIDGVPEDRGTDEQGRVAIPMEPGVYDMSVTKSGYVTEGREVEVRLTAPYVQEERFTLRRVLLPLKVRTNPPGAKVLLDEGREGVSNAEGLLVFEKINPSVQHSLRASKENYADETVTVPPYKLETMVRLRRDLLTLKVKTYPAQAEVYLDGELKGTSDAAGVLIIPKVKTDREHALHVSREGYITQSVSVPPNYELFVIKLPLESGREATPEAQSGQGGAGQRPEVGGGDSGSVPRADAPQGEASGQGDGRTPAARSGEVPATTTQPQSVSQESVSGLLLEVELKFWDSIKASADPEEFAAYLKKYPQGHFDELARIRMNALLAKKNAAPQPATTPTPEPAKPPPTSAPTPSPTPTTAEKPTRASAERLLPTSTATLKPAPERPNPAPVPTPAANAQPAAAGAAAGAPTLEEAIGWLRDNFAAKFSYRETASAEGSDIELEPIKFEGCYLEWRNFANFYSVSLSDLDPVAVAVRTRVEAETMGSGGVWGVVLTSISSKYAFKKLEGGPGGQSKIFRSVLLLYDDREKAGRLATAFKQAIELCGGKAQP